MNLERLRTVREENEYSQSDIAKFLGISQSTYSNYETGMRKISIDVLIRLADLYDVSLDYLVDRKRFNLPRL